jgi:transcriptional regulator with XRE-family HTH domain
MSSYSFAIAARIDEILARKGWNKTDFANAMGKTNAEISKWMSGQHNFTIATIAKIEVALGEDILSVKHYRKTVSGYNALPESRKRLLSEKAAKYREKE